MLDPKVAESLQFLHDLIHVDGVSPIPGKDVMDNQFMAGQVAMISRGHWIVQGAKRANLNMDIAIPPAKESDTTVIGFGGYAVSKTAAGPRARPGAGPRAHQRRDPDRGGRGRRRRAGPQVGGRDRGLPRLPAERRALLPDAAAHQARALARQLPGGREDLHPLLHRDDGGRGLDRRRRQAGRRRAQRLLRAAEEADGRTDAARGAAPRASAACPRHDRGRPPGTGRPACAAPRRAPATSSSCRRRCSTPPSCWRRSSSPRSSPSPTTTR